MWFVDVQVVDQFIVFGKMINRMIALHLTLVQHIWWKPLPMLCSPF